jgi:glycerophosphoryl diester phosphodiesterase
MPKVVKRLRIPFTILAVIVAGLWLGNNSTFVTVDDKPFLLAHRGLAQTFDVSRVQSDTCTAQVIHQPEHAFLENTLASMRAAFEAGADVVEFDVKLTSDNQLAVFHDATLECRTNGTGTVADHTMGELRKLDIGYGYTADNGATHPFRGKGAGLMPTAPEVLAAFPDRELLIHLKSGEAADGDTLATLLAPLPEQRRAQLTVYGEDVAVDAFHAKLPDVRATSKAMMKKCLVRYAATGWTGHIPADCRNTQLHLPQHYGRYLWGWPNRFTERMSEAGTRVILTADGGDFSAGFDAPADLENVPNGWSGGIWTNRMDLL